MSKAKLAQIDYLAVSQDSRLHAWSVLPKTIAFAAVLFGIVFSQRPRQVFLLLSVLLLTLLSNKLPFGCVAGRYILLFSACRLRWLSCLLPSDNVADGDQGDVGCSALADIGSQHSFSAIAQRSGTFLPPLLVDTVWFTYRLFFILLGKALQMLSALRRRGAFARGNFCWSCRMVFNAWGWLLLLMLQVSQQLMQSYRLRGYDHSLPAQVECPPAGRRDWLGAMLSIALVGGVLLLG